MILIVDDQDDARRFLQLLLRKHGYQVRSARDAREALDLSRQRVPRLFILDYNMPQMTGLDLLTEIRADAVLFACRAIFFSAAFEHGMAKRAFDMGCSEWLVKGVHGPAHLLAAVARAVNPA